MCSNSLNKGYSVGLGTTGNCNLSCPHCYSLPLRGNSLTYDDVVSLISSGEISSINFGTGENILNPDFEKIIDLCNSKNIKMSITSNGYSILSLSDEKLKMFNDVDISLDYADEQEQNDFRHGDSWNFAKKAMEKCRRLGIEFSIATALMNENYKQIPDLLNKVAKEGCNLRLNVFKKVIKAGITKYSLSYDEFWEAVRLLFEHGKLISCSEPVVNAMLGIQPIVPKSPCGTNSFRVHPNGDIVPCVYWPEGDLTLDDIVEDFDLLEKSKNFNDVKSIPKYCLDECDKVEVCGGGCASRRYINGDLNTPDEYCPIYLGKEVPDISVEYSESSKDLVHASYLCTFIFEGKQEEKE